MMCITSLTSAPPSACMPYIIDSVPGPMAAFIPLTGDTRVAKFRNLILRGIDHDADRYEAASQDGGEGGIGPTPLEERSFLLRNQREAAKNAAAQRAAADTERASVRRRLNEGNETFMGIRTSPTDRGVSIPAGAENRPAVANAVQRLGSQPTAIPGGMYLTSHMLCYMFCNYHMTHTCDSFDNILIISSKEALAPLAGLKSKPALPKLLPRAARPSRTGQVRGRGRQGTPIPSSALRSWLVV